ncbi:ubiquitin carboxyl-terminal hydrolase [Chlorella sorokiniana]|uniref:Ubiquitin carboxyl-terminal hydrolase n=1 Tax=Chlorella sorokiniana TaxID=3076 RepID=A0A2P6TUJ6_CHLSO|nr:ubiquitin carboxyl-terminal hydrolase [Chlorella sorokiniana]|eukprot:PRW57724.1 ubiquitin carboxyl-terminal hydrolase [Chlorella sorokiniana]
MGRKQVFDPAAAGSSAPGVTSSSASAQNGAAAAQGAPGVADARKLLSQYAKGARCADALQQLEALHRRSPSHMTCLALAKVYVRRAVDVALKEDGDDDVQEAAVVPPLNAALRYAVDGVTVHHSPNCLSLCEVLMSILCGRTGVRERRDMLDKLASVLPDRKEALALDWVDPAAELVTNDRWPTEAAEGVTVAAHLQRRLGPFLEKLRSSMEMDAIFGLVEGSGHNVMYARESVREHAAMPVHVRLYRVAGLPEKVTDPLHRKALQRQGSAEQERRRRQQEERAGEAERQRTLRRLEMASRKRAQGLPDLQKQADKVRAFLLRRMAAAAEEQAGGAASEGQQAAQLEALLQQTEVTPEQLQELLRRAQLPQEQQRLVQRCLGLAEQRQDVCYDLPKLGAEALAASATAPERQQLSSATLDGERFAAALHQLVWGNPKFAEGQAAAVHQTAEQLKHLNHLALSSKVGVEVGWERDWLLPDPQSVDVLAECPGDMQVLMPLGAHAPAAGGGGGGGSAVSVSSLAAGAAALSASLARQFERQREGSAQAGSPGASPRAGALSELDNVDDEFVPAGGSAVRREEQPRSLQALEGGEAESDDGPLLMLHAHQEQHRTMRYMLGLLLSKEESEPLRSQALINRLQDPSSVQQQTDQRLRHSLLGAELLSLLEQQSADGALARASVHGSQPATAQQLALQERWERLDQCWDGQSAEKVAQQLAEPGELEELEQLLRALRDGSLGLSQPPSAVALGACVQELRLCRGAALLPGGQQEVQLADYLKQAREHLTRGVLAGLQSLSSGRRLVPNLLMTICEFVRCSLVETADARSDDQEAAAAFLLSLTGRLPLRRLLQLHAFLAVRMVDNVVGPKDLDRELQELLCVWRQQAEHTPRGGIRLSESGLAALAQEIAVLEALRTNKLSDTDEVSEPDMLVPTVAAEQLAAYCCGLPHAAAEVAVMIRGEEASVVEQTLQGLEAGEAKECVALLQRAVYVRRMLSAMFPTLQQPLHEGDQLLKALGSLLERLQQLSRINGGVLVDFSVRREVSKSLGLLSIDLLSCVDSLCEALALAEPAETAMQKAMASFELSVVANHYQQLKAEQLAGNKGLAEQLQAVKREVEALTAREESLEAEGVLTSSLIDKLKREAQEQHTLILLASRQLNGPLGTDSMYDQAGMLALPLRRLAEMVVKAIATLQSSQLMICLMKEVALERARALEGYLVCAVCMQPSLLPVFAALSRHLLALKWQDDMAAEQEAEAAQREAQRQALEEELLNEEQSGQGKDDKSKEKRRAKKAAKKERRAAAAEVAAKEAAAAKVGGVAPTQLESVERRRQEEQEDGLRRLLQQIDAEAAAGGEAPTERQQAQQAQQAAQVQQQVQQVQQPQEAQQAERPQQPQEAQQAERPGSPSDYFDPAVLAGEDEVWATPLSSPMPDALEASLEGVELMADAPAAPASPRPQQSAAAASKAPSAEPLPAVAAAEQQPQRSKSPEQAQQAQHAEQPQQQEEAGESWETAGSKRQAKQGAAGRAEAPQQQAAAAPAAAPPAVRAASVQAGRPAAARAAAPAPVRQQQQAADARASAQPAAAADKVPAAPPTAPPPAADAEPASPAAAAAAAELQDDDGWEEAPSQRRRGGKHNAAAKPAAVAAPGRTQLAQAEPVRHYQRVINWAGDWICECGQRNAARCRCFICDVVESPCREYCFQGGCSRGGNPPDGNCKFTHPPFELPSARRPPTKKGPHQHSGQIVDLIADGSRDDGKPCMRPPPGDAEEAELAAAIQASLADAAAVASRHQAGAWQELPAAPRSSGGAAAGAQDTEALALAGLRNEAGEYNCFLNVVVQCLWRCAEFRQQVAGWDASFQARDPVLAALHALFAQLEQQEAARSSAAARGGNGGGRLPPVDPAPLREALAALPGQGFSLGEMNDAAELLLCVYEKVMEAEGPSGRANELAATFGLAVREEVHCAACGKTTHQNAYTQYFYNTQATTLQMARLVVDGAASMGALLRDAEAQHRKSCDTDMSGCGALNSVNHFLQGAPRVFTLQVAWETHAPDQDMVAGTLAALDETVDLGEVYQGVERGLHRYALRSMVCYYGQHYQALVLVPEAGGWLMFDDTRVTRVGTWADVRRKCEAGRIQPSVLFYEAAA